MSLAVFLPTRKGSQRVPNKNTRPFAGVQHGLLELKLKQLVKLKVDEIILSTNDEASIEIVNKITPTHPNLKLDIRPGYLASSSTNLSDLIAYVPTITNCEHILWTHVTSPFVDTELYNLSINKYENSLSQGFDSLISVTPFQNFLWSREENDIINRLGKKRWPQTQDLKKIYEINSAIFLSPRSVYEKNGDRVGKKPFLFEMNKIQSLDIDWEDDFKIAEAVYEKLYK
ncbi:hypothetical protein [Gramella sp. AN32]|uniref:Cytidylyltransferase domain-containing protein n=1 Tax=Christiangramia antarctica TaxID=2058158 RepID=A0ABW5X222_9FLAO|nr:hypothetical protein [Gramella sp. AN32]MCM4157115.1 acylneuraminate cytidylyltransferase [Gramella sp. AN32]